MTYSMNLFGKGRNTHLETDIAQSLWLIMFTAKGSRIYLPDYAADALEYLDKPQWEVQRLMVAIAESVAKYEPRVSLKTIEVIDTALDVGLIVLRAHYEIIATGDSISGAFSSKAPYNI